MTAITREVGVALIINTNLNPKQIRSNTILEIVAIDISEPIHAIIAQLQHVPTCIVDDFNEDVSIKSNTHCCTMFRLQGFMQIVNKPTHNSGTIIDHVYVLQIVKTMQINVTDCYDNDHDCILCLITV